MKLLATVAMASLLSGVSSGAEWDSGTGLLSVSGGVVVPVGDLADTTSSGWAASIAVDRFINSRWALGADVAFSRPGVTGSDALFASLLLGAHVKHFTAGFGKLRPHMLAGAGGYIFFGDALAEALFATFAGGEPNPLRILQFGLNGGAGITYRTGRQGELGLEATFHHVLVGRNQILQTPGHAVQFVTVVARLVFFR